MGTGEARVGVVRKHKGWCHPRTISLKRYSVTPTHPTHHAVTLPSTAIHRLQPTLHLSPSTPSIEIKMPLFPENTMNSTRRPTLEVYRKEHMGRHDSFRLQRPPSIDTSSSTLYTPSTKVPPTPRNSTNPSLSTSPRSVRER